MHFWLDFGVDGFRLDAVPYLMERSATTNESLPETHDVLRAIRSSISRRDPNVVLLAEANQPPREVVQYFGDGDECQMAFHFPLMPQLFMAIAKGYGRPIASIVTQTQDIPGDCQWVIFLRNHDELSLEMVSEQEREELWSIYAPNENARINLGIRRRLAPLMGGDRRRVQLMHALLLSLPGSPALYYGDEIGMGDDLKLEDRDGVRTPMQWDNTRNGGFSDADPRQLTRSMIDNGQYGYANVNVATQEGDDQSMLHWMRHALSIRSARRCFAHGTCTFEDVDNSSILAYVRQFDGRKVLCVSNLSGAKQTAAFSARFNISGNSLKLFGHGEIWVKDQDGPEIELSPYQHLWLDVSASFET